jgi:hypothetical protein
VTVCPAGTFGIAGGLNSSLCSGLCTAGYACPAGSINSTVAGCGNASVYAWEPLRRSCIIRSALSLHVLLWFSMWQVLSCRLWRAVDRRCRFLLTSGGRQCGAPHRSSCVSRRRVLRGRGSLQLLGRHDQQPRAAEQPVHDAVPCRCCTLPCAASLTHRDAIAQRLPLHLVVRVTGYFCPNGTSVVSPSISCFSATTHCPSGSRDRQWTPSGHYAVAVAGSNPPVFGSERECQPGTYCEAGVRLSCSGV